MFRLRLTVERFEQLLGGKKRWWMTYLIIVTFAQFILSDLFRHYLMLYTADKADLIL